jgi:hypothetical protein
MRYASILSLALVSTLAIAEFPVPTPIVKALAPWQPIAVEISAGSVTAKLPQPAITHDMYYAAVGAVCSTLWGSPGAWGGLKVSELRILNAHGARGFALEGDVAAICAEAGDVKPAQTRMHYAGHTRAE